MGRTQGMRRGDSPGMSAASPSFMKTTKQKKLRVARETIRVLQDRQLGAVAGGNSALGGYCYRTDATVVNCCPTTH